MDINKKNRICPVEHAGVLDLNLRKLIQNPKKILKPYINNGMTVLDLGCGPGFFTLEISKIIGTSGKVIAADLQEGMLEKIRKKIENSSIYNNIKLHKCQKNKIGILEKVDFILVFYMLHEIPDQSAFLKELKILLKPEGKILIVEPKFHVSKNDFNDSMMIIKDDGFSIIKKPKILFSRSVVIRKDF